MITLKNTPYTLFAVILFLAGSSILVPLSATPSHLSSHQNAACCILYVDDDNTVGPWDGSLNHPFQYIQDAITNATPYDAIFVFSGTYREYITVTKTLTITGEDTSTTIIDANHSHNPVTVLAPHCTIANFTIQNSGQYPSNTGILLHTTNTTITHCTMHHNYHGITFHNTHQTTITYATIANNTWNGIQLQACSTQNTIKNNTLQNNGYTAIHLTDCSHNNIHSNNFLTNRHHAYDNAHNLWDHPIRNRGNYWDDYTGLDADGNGIGDIPYDIPGGINQDEYPLMSPHETQDTTPPYLLITSPQNGIYLRDRRILPFVIRQHTLIVGRITIQATATDTQSSIEKVDFYIEGNPNLQWSDYSEPYTWLWNQPILTNHKKTLYVVAYDTAGNFNIASLTVRKYL